MLINSTLEETGLEPQVIPAQAYVIPKKQNTLLLALLLISLMLTTWGCGRTQEENSPTAAATLAPAISNLLGLIGLSAEAADDILGKPYNTKETPAQETVPKLPLGGVRHDYDYEDYTISLLFDKQEPVSKAVFVWGGLATHEYKLENASALLDKMGVNVTSPFDVSDDQSVSWYDDNGYQIYMALGHKTGEHEYARGGTYIDRVYISVLP